MEEVPKHAPSLASKLHSHHTYDMYAQKAIETESKGSFQR